MRIINETTTAVCMEHDDMLFLVPLPQNFNIVATYVDRLGNFQPVYHRSVYGEQVHNALKELANGRAAN